MPTDTLVAEFQASTPNERDRLLDSALAVVDSVTSIDQ